MSVPDPDLDPADDGPQPARWERQPGETARAYSAFGLYRDAGPMRTLRKVAAAFYAQPGETIPLDAVSSARLGQCKTWSAQNDWVARAEAWDAYLDEVSRLEQIEAAKTMRGQYVTLAMSMRGRIAQTLQAMAGAAETVPVRELPRWLEAAQKVEAWARDVPSEIVEHRDEDQDTKDRKALGHEIIGAMRDEVAAKRATKAVGE